MGTAVPQLAGQGLGMGSREVGLISEITHREREGIFL